MGAPCRRIWRQSDVPLLPDVQRDRLFRDRRHARSHRSPGGCLRRARLPAPGPLGLRGTKHVWVRVPENIEHMDLSS